MKGEHGDFGVLTVGASDDAFAAVVDLIVDGVSVLDDLQAGADLAAQLLISEVAAGKHRAERLQQNTDHIFAFNS
jgi:hypothetical protein